MSQTILDIPIGNTWISLNSAAAISVGDSMLIQNKSTNWLVFAEGSQPSATSTDGVYVSPMHQHDSNKFIVTGSLEIWARTVLKDTTAEVSIQIA